MMRPQPRAFIAGSASRIVWNAADRFTASPSLHASGLKFSIGNGRKDMSYYTHLAESLGTVSFVGEAVHQSLVQAVALGLGSRFMPSLLEAQETLNGIGIVPRAQPSRDR